MRRIAIGFTVAVMVLMLASVAAAVPPKCEIDPNLPGCGGDDEPTTTTTEPQLQPCPTDTWTLSGNGQTRFECLWRPVNDGSPVATVTVTGALSGPPLLLIRDDSPGDICVLAQDETDWDEPHTGPDYVASFDLYYDEVPEAAPPDVLDYSAWLGQSYADFILEVGMEPGTHWCAPQDTVLSSIREDNNGGAFHILVGFHVKKGDSLDITLFPENSL